HPSFYGCLDWHSSVHGHWMLVKLLRDFPEMPEAKQIREALNQNLEAQRILAEKAYFDKPINATFERTYGWVWLLKLALELHSWNTAESRQWEQNLQPLTDLIIERYMAFLPKQTYPIRQGMHPNTAFGLTFAYDYAQATHNAKFQAMIEKRGRDYFGQDTEAPLKWEPNGADFLSPSLEEADLMRRLMPKAEFSTWLNRFLPAFAEKAPKNMLEPAVVGDRADMQIVHLDGLNLSRAWCMLAIAKNIGENSPVGALFMRSAKTHLDAALPHIASGEYGGEHWLASFAVYALAQE
ncbi:MAG: DUF2891 domain-containing protein, partial [Mucilaginibacter polytrichastri]|nr:DUF2891 domain-containing protein [Mucilaginibacter polytrichastri]